jgi:hypothetical protein
LCTTTKFTVDWQLWVIRVDSALYRAGPFYPRKLPSQRTSRNFRKVPLGDIDVRRPSAILAFVPVEKPSTASKVIARARAVDSLDSHSIEA